MAAATTVRPDGAPGDEPPRYESLPLCPPGEHEYRHARGQDGDVSRDVPACKRPRRMQCQRCPSMHVLPCENSATAVCEPCGQRYRRRVQTVALIGSGVDVDVAAAAVAQDGDDDELAALQWLGQQQGTFTTLVLTLTAGSQHGRHRDRTQPGQPWCECTPAGGVDLAKWNGEMGVRWTHFLEDLRRSSVLGDRGGVQYFRAVEVQDGKRRLDGRGRMALHEHVLVRVPGVVRVDLALVAALRRLAIRHGYGHELVVERAAVSKDGRARLAAWYAAKYVSKAADVRGIVPWDRRLLDVVHDQVLVEVADVRTGEVVEHLADRVTEKWSPSTYKTWTASRQWGCSMGAVKASQRAYARLLASAGDEDLTTAPADRPPLPRPPAGAVAGGASP